MLAAAAAWEGVADELRSTASTYQSVISELTGEELAGADIGIDVDLGHPLSDMDEGHRSAS